MYYPSRIPALNSTAYIEQGLDQTEYKEGGLGRTALEQGGYQFAALGVTIGLAIVGGLLTGLIMKIPLLEQVDEEDMFDDEPYWAVPNKFSFELEEETADSPSAFAKQLKASSVGNI